jgi:hypothetical protein
MFGINVYGQRIGSTFEGQHFQEDILVLEDRTNTLPRNVGSIPPIDAGQHPRRSKASRKLPLLLKVQTGYGDHPASYSTDSGATSLEVKRPGVQLAAHLNIVPRLRVTGAIPPLFCMLS